MLRLLRNFVKTKTMVITNSYNIQRYQGNRLDYKINVDKIYQNEYELKIMNMLKHYREKGHHFSRLDPLEILKNNNEFPNCNDFGLKYKDEIKEINGVNIVNNSESMSDLESKLKKMYLSYVGVEFQQFLEQNPEEEDWLYNTYEECMSNEISQNEEKEILKLILESEGLDQFLHKKFGTFKRYGCEGAEGMIILMDKLLRECQNVGIEKVVLAMPHRGRLNVLVNLLQYPLDELIRKIQGRSDIPSSIYSGIDDVVSHISCSNFHINSKTKVSMIHNPSHLETSNPVSQGKTRAKMEDSLDAMSVLNLQLHGDAAFSGQGVVYEALLLNQLQNYSVHGTIHVVVNNQIGYTTAPLHGRQHKYCSEIVKAFPVPILHVNANHIPSILNAVRFALIFRTKYKQDILIDLNCYRKYGHNEVDEPSFTQPSMYNIIRSSKYVLSSNYTQHLINSNIIDHTYITNIKQQVLIKCEQAFENAKISLTDEQRIQQLNDEQFKGNRTMTEKWSSVKLSMFGQEPNNTGVEINILKELGLQSVNIDKEFTVHQRLSKFFVQDRIKQIEQNVVDWSTGETMAVMSLINDGFNVRMSGQDVERGTFSQRHWVMVDQKNETELNNIQQYSEQITGRGRFQVKNSPLSEYSVLCYEWGYASETSLNLNIWEAQFGDFFNGGQIFFDTYLTCSESKWLRSNAMVVLLPHGFDGMGPEHSSCRIERFLQMGNSDGINEHFKYSEHNLNRSHSQVSDDNFYSNYQDINFQFANPTTPANYFHLLRRQMLRNYRKPLVIASPKQLLRSAKAVSHLSLFDTHTSFQPIIQYYNSNLNQKTRIIICSGKYVYDIQRIIDSVGQQAQSDTLLISLEELLPFPESQLNSIFSQLNKNCKVYWVQEEPINQGAFTFSKPHIQRQINKYHLTDKQLYYIGRKAIAAVAVGNKYQHEDENKQLENSISQILI